MKKQFLDYETLLFDLDGTLIDSACGLIGALNDTIKGILPGEAPF